LKGREAALASPKSKSPLPRVVNYQRRAGFLCNLTDLVTLHFHNCVFLAHKAGQVRHKLEDFVTCAVSIPYCLQHGVYIAVYYAQQRNIKIPCKLCNASLRQLTILQSVQQGGFAVCICYIVVHREHVNAAHAYGPAIKACKENVMASSCP